MTATGSEAFPGTYKTQADLVSLGVNWRSDLAFLFGGEVSVGTAKEELSEGEDGI